MTETIVFDAPWDQRLMILTAVFTTIMVGAVAVLVWLALTRQGATPMRAFLLASATILLAVSVVGALMGPRRFTIGAKSLRIERPLFAIDIPLASIEAVEMLGGESLSGTLRTFGNGGYFGYFGRFRNSALGYFRMYATRSAGYVLVRAERSYVLTPGSPERFVETLNGRRGTLVEE